MMRKAVYFIGLITSISVCMGWLFKLLYWPGGGGLTTYGYLGFSLLFLPMLYLEKYRKNVPADLSEKFKVILGFSGAWMVGLSVLFKVMHFPGADWLLISGTLLFSFGFLPLLFYSMYRRQWDQ